MVDARAEGTAFSSRELHAVAGRRRSAYPMFNVPVSLADAPAAPGTSWVTVNSPATLAWATSTDNVRSRLSFWARLRSGTVAS
jgi:hypothetical protein